MKFFLRHVILIVSFSSIAQTFTNPILSGAYPDPSICMVDGDFYLVNSSFEYFPGLPIHKSKDLVNWELIGYGLDRENQCNGTNNLVDVQSNGGIHAPTIRHHEGIFYIITTNIYSPVEGPTQFINFIITAEDPADSWSEPHIIEGAPGIDPDLFFDDDGKVWFVGTHDKGDKNANGIGELWVQELDLAKWQLKGERTSVWTGACGGCCLEGPHMYKREGTYYLMAAEGGTSFNHAVMIAASDKITGPYDSNPRNPILTSRHLSKDNWVHSTGHADLVNVPDGRWFMVALGKRGDEQRESNMGRETHLIPISWEKATVRWQQVSDNEWAPVTYDFPVGAPETGKVERINPMPFMQTRQYQKDAFNDNFDESKLNLEWNFRRVPQANTFSLAARSGHLRLYAKPEVIENRVQASLMGFRQRESDFEYTASIYYQPKKEGEEAGMSLFQKDNNYINFTLTKEQGLMVLKVILKDPKEDSRILRQEILSNYEGEIMLRVISKDHQYQYQYSLDQGREYITFMSSKGDLILSHRTGSYTGAYLGLYATGNGKSTKAFMDVDWVFYQGYPRS